jgi:hypothetical protein
LALLLNLLVTGWVTAAWEQSSIIALHTEKAALR